MIQIADPIAICTSGSVPQAKPHSHDIGANHPSFRWGDRARTLLALVPVEAIRAIIIMALLANDGDSWLPLASLAAKLISDLQRPVCRSRVQVSRTHLAGTTAQVMINISSDGL